MIESTNFKQEIRNSSKSFFKIRYRYVGNLSAVVGTKFDIESFLHIINNKFPSK